MNVLLLHDRIAPDARPDELDVLVQVDAIRAALGELGHASEAMAFSLDLAAVNDALRRAQPDCVFNLVESVEGHGRFAHLAPAILDALRIPYTGTRARGMMLTSNKLLAKRRLRGHGLPTADWVEAGGIELQEGPDGHGPVVSHCRTGKALHPESYIVKSVWEHASLGLDEDAIVEARSPDDLRRVIGERAPRLGGEAFAEVFVDGREFNTSLIAGTEGARVLPHAEIVFEDYPAGRPRIVDYRAKWMEESFEYQHTARRFDFPASDAGLLEELTRLARACWRAFDLRGYARVDFRVDGAGRPFILEINANPCLSPDAGFAAALERAGIGMADAVKRILDDAGG